MRARLTGGWWASRPLGRDGLARRPRAGRCRSTVRRRDRCAEWGGGAQRCRQCVEHANPATSAPPRHRALPRGGPLHQDKKRLLQREPFSKVVANMLYYCCPIKPKFPRRTGSLSP